MCGIVAHVSFNNSDSISKSLLEKMARDINHRGPDDEGFFINNWVGLGFKRLSILDLSANGHQPMADENNQFIVTLNGEIYNYLDLRKELEIKGYTFFSNTDTEVLLKSYIEWGTDCLKKLNGMFAFIIYDKKKNEVIVARDHLGIKPIYFHINNNFAVFGSEIKSFRHKIAFELNTTKLYEQFMYNYISGKETPFKGIYRVLPGTFLTITQDGKLNETEFYNITGSILTNSYDVYDIDRIEDELKNSILQHTQSDVGYNIQLSGGLDSSYITAVLKKEYKHDLTTYSVEIEGSNSINESEFQKHVAQKYNTSHHSLLLTAKDLRENYEKATWFHDIPIHHPPSVFLMLLCEESKKNSKVILTGEGADELFAGYSRHKLPLLYRTQYWLKKNSILLNLLPEIGKMKSQKLKIMSTEFGVDESVYFNKNSFLSLFNNIGDNIDYRKHVISKIKPLSQKILASDQTSHLNWLFERQDKMSMAASVESRVPFSNFKLFEIINKIDPKQKIKDSTKSILKKLALKYYEPNFVYRRKNGFVLPYDDWFRDPNGLKPLLDFLTDKTFKERGIYDSARINKMITNHLAGKENSGKFFINILNFEIWHRIFIDKKSSYIN